MKAILKEFREFAVKGNAIDMAVGLTVGAGFTKIVNSLVNDMIMPPVGFLLGGKDFSHFSIILKEATPTTPEVVLKYGMFVNTLVDFLIVAFSIFMIVKGINRLKRKQP